MFVLEPSRLETRILNELLILGLYWPYFVFCVLPILGFILWLVFKVFYDSYKRGRNQAIASISVLLEIAPISGGPVARHVCEFYKGEAKKVENRSRATFMATIFAKPPEGHAIDAYYLLPEHEYLENDWPFDAPKSQKYPIIKYYFTENDPCPKIPHDPSKWDTERYDRITSSIAKLSKDEAGLQIIVSEMSGIWQNIQAFLDKLKMAAYAFYTSLVNVLIQLGIAFMLYQIWQRLDGISRFLVGK
jgi:hypothetical protein